MEKKSKIYVSVISVLGALVLVLSVLLGVNMANNQSLSYWQQKYNSFAVQNANSSQGQIVFVGDSITDLCPLDQYYSDLALATYNRGIGGDTTSGILDRMKVSLFDIAPSKIVLMIGINDINCGIVVNQIATNYSNILSQIKNQLPTAQVFCMSVLPMEDKICAYAQLDLETQNNIVVQLNTQIFGLCAQYEYTYVNLFDQVKTADNKLQSELTDDGIHLNANGFQIWADLIKPQLV